MLCCRKAFGHHKVGNLSMEENAYPPQRCGRMVGLTGDMLEGRIILGGPRAANRRSRWPSATMQGAAELPESDGPDKRNHLRRANQVVGNAVVRAQRPKASISAWHPPLLVTTEEGDKTSEDVVRRVMICFESRHWGNVFIECRAALQQAADERSHCGGAPERGGR